MALTCPSCGNTRNFLVKTLQMHVVRLDDARVEVKQFDGLLVDFARTEGANLIIRGLRAVADFEYEFQMALMNRHLAPALETVFMVPSLDTTYISSSLVREVARFRGDVTDLVHPDVAKALRVRLQA